jgi:hypothetical protein
MLGDVTIRGKPYGGSPVVIRTYAGFGGAVGSLVWRGIQFIDVHDHGRELQISVHYPPGDFYEVDEAGQHGTGPSLSRVLSARKLGANEMTDTVRPWLYRGSTLSPDTLLSKRVTIGPLGMPANVIEFDTSVTVTGRRPSYQVEAPTSYMPESFNTFYYHAGAHWVRLSASRYHRNVSHPVVAFDQKDGVAMGVYGFGKPEGYGVRDFGFVTKATVGYSEGGSVHGTYHYMAYLVVGPLAAVERTLARVTASQSTSGAAASKVSHDQPSGAHLQVAKNDGVAHFIEDKRNVGGHTMDASLHHNIADVVWADRFVFNSLMNTGHADTIADVRRPDGGKTMLSRSDFQAQSLANPTTGLHCHGQDGSRHDGPIHFAPIAPGLEPHHSEFLVHA